MATYPTVELYVNSTWTDIASYVRYANMIEITRGQSGEGATTDNSTCKLTLENTDGRFSPRNPTGTYYGQIGRNTPIRVSLDGGETYLDCPGGSGDRASTPDAAALDIVGDIDVRIELSVVDWAALSTAELIGKYNQTGNQRSWRILLDTDGYPMFTWSADGTNITTATATSSLADLGVRRVALRATLDVDNGSGGKTVTFYTSDSISGTWTQLGSAVTTATTTSIFASTATLEIADISNLSFNPMVGRVHKVSVRSGIGGTEVANPDFTAQSVGATSFADGAGLTWTISGNASIKNRKERFVGEVSAWPVTSDISGEDVTVSVEAAGILRRLGQGASPLQSSMMRFIKSPGIFDPPIECWPLTDGELSSYGAPMFGTANMIPTLTSGTTPVKWAGGSLADWIEPVAQFPTSTDGRLKAFLPVNSDAATGWCVDFCRSGRGDFDRFQVVDHGAGTDADPYIVWTIDVDDTADVVELVVASVGETTSSTLLLDSNSAPGIFDDDPHMIRLVTQVSGANSAWVLYIDGVEVGSGTAAGYASESVYSIKAEWDQSALTSDPSSVGFITYWGPAATAPTPGDTYDALIGHRGETAGARIERLCDEEDITYQRIGNDTTPTMRPQRMETLVDLLRECETTDMGILYEPRDQIGLAYRDRVSLYNQAADLALNYGNHQLAEALNPTEDDQLTRNDITVTQLYGNSHRATLDTGTLSTLAPPNGVGRYDEAVTASLDDDDDLPNYAGWRLHLGTVDEARYPTVALNLRHSTFTASTSMMEDALALDVGDRLTITNVPSWWPPDQISQLSVGFTERLGALERDVVVNCAPESPFHVAYVEGSDYERADTDGSTLAEALDTTETGVDVLTTIGSAQWIDSATYASEFPFDVRTGGEVMRVTACTHGLSDDFSANQTDSWGTADVGGTWTNSGGTVGGDYDVAGGVGTHTLTSVNTSRRSFLTAPSASFDIYCDIATSALATGDSLYGGVMARYVDVDNLYMARLEFTTGNAIILAIRERAAGAEATLGSAVTLGLTHVAGTYYRVRVQGSGTALKAKAWLTTDLEPGPWQVSTTDSTLSSAGSIGCRSIAGAANTNVNPVVSYDNFKLINPQTFTVTRSQNGVVKSHSSGADLRLAYPPIIPF